MREVGGSSPPRPTILLFVLFIDLTIKRFCEHLIVKLNV